MAMEEGLVSTDVAVIKQARQVAKGKVTRNINSLDFALVQDTEENFIFNEINEKRVEDIYATLLSSYETFQELHDRHVEYASPGTDEQMLKFIEDESVYARNVAVSVSTVDQKYAEFLTASEAAKSRAGLENKLSSLKKEVARYKTRLEGKASAASLVINATDLNKKKTAKVVKTELSSALDSYEAKVSEYDEALVLIDKDLETKFTEEKDFSNIIKTVEDLIVSLEAIALELPDSKAASGSPSTDSDSFKWSC